MSESKSKDILSFDGARKNEENYIPPKQSANTLFRFFKEPEYLFDSLEKESMIPRYYPETVNYLDIDMLHVAYPMICFCDINLHKIDDHMFFYGGYGLAFSKKWGIQKGIQPIQYINPHSILHSDFSNAFKSAIKCETEDFAQNYLLTQMFYFKPIEGTMERDGTEKPKNFTDECEWRFIPNVTVEELPQAVLETEIFSLPTLNKAISVKKSCWLEFDLEDIKYIIIQTNEDFVKLIELIETKLMNSEKKSRLISKILVWENAKGDF
ncbi:abortive infection system antitoxin AbiGi family protein [Lacrimispora xylanolytica]|uniref:Abortive infection system antitoxin AbiGi family protein n=1 Tax=Lacrimispora xylanolytica TaxID=29375 RepID=A0ABY7A5Z3_9FIRM|nr:abortive infection system antitoxin AbiGi family protein [Lacrimispora xylanolytica]WAJ22085.1 abortive infection system antitoxin AbiGi family protein [Lacrimispora xylanolytica]